VRLFFLGFCRSFCSWWLLFDDGWGCASAIGFGCECCSSSLGENGSDGLGNLGDSRGGFAPSSLVPLCSIWKEVSPSVGAVKIGELFEGCAHCGSAAGEHGLFRTGARVDGEGIGAVGDVVAVDGSFNAGLVLRLEVLPDAVAVPESDAVVEVDDVFDVVVPVLKVELIGGDAALGPSSGLDEEREAVAAGAFAVSEEVSAVGV
jgi:hypothetical protein